LERVGKYILKEAGYIIGLGIDVSAG